MGVDIVDLSNLTPGDAYVALSHQSFLGLTHGISVTINDITNTGIIEKGGNNGSTTIINVAKALKAGLINDGLGINGTETDDTYHVNVGDNGWMLIRGGNGVDSYRIDGDSGIVRLDFVDGTSGARANLSKSVIYNDGHGNRAAIAGTGSIGELHATMSNDVITGSSNDERFILMAGTDVLDGRGGSDFLNG